MGSLEGPRVAAGTLPVGTQRWPALLLLHITTGGGTCMGAGQKHASTPSVHYLQHLQTD
jgi:hypothetical protein